MRVLVATDGSDVSIEAARRAAALWPSDDVEFAVVTVILPEADPNADAGGFAGPTQTPEGAREEHRADVVDANAVLAETARGFGARPIEQRLAEGDPAISVVELAEELEADVVVVGSHGKGLARRLLLGSTSQQIVRDAPCPVLVVRSPS